MRSSRASFHPRDFEEGGRDASDLLVEVLRILRRRFKSMALGAILAAIPLGYYIATMPEVYEATAKVAIQETPEVIELGPDYMPSQTTPRRGLGSTIALVASDAVLARVVDDLTPQRPEAVREESEDRPPTGLAGWLERAGWPSISRPESQRSAAQLRHLRTEEIRRSLELGSEGEGTILTVKATTRSAAGAAALANSVAQKFVEYRVEEREAALERATSWLSRRVLELRGQIQSREQAIARMQPPPQDGGARADLERDLRSAEIDLMATRRRLEEIRPLALERRAAQEEDAGRARLEARYEQATAALEAAPLAGLTETHPEVVRLKQIVANLKERLASESPPDTQAASLIGEYEELQGLEARQAVRVAVLQSALAGLVEAEFPAAGTRAVYERLERELEVDRSMLELLLRRRNETILSAATEYPDARILDLAIVPLEPAGPNRPKWLAMGLVVSLGAGAGLGLLRELLDRRVRDRDQIADILGAKYLGAVPKAKLKKGQVPAAVTESYRRLRTTLLFSARPAKKRAKATGRSRSLVTVGSPRAAAGEPARGMALGALLVTSGLAGEGKTTISVNLAQSLAGSGRTVLLVDADLRRPQVHKVLSLVQAPGLSEVLAEEAASRDVIQSLPLGFDVIPSGRIPDNPSELLGSPRADSFLSQMREAYDAVLVDSPVLLSVPDALLLAEKTDLTLLVCKPGSLESSALAQMRVDLEQARANVVGFVLSQVKVGDRDLYPSYLNSPYTYPEPLRPRWRPWRRQSGKGAASRPDVELKPSQETEQATKANPQLHS